MGRDSLSPTRARLDPDHSREAGSCSWWSCAAPVWTVKLIPSPPARKSDPGIQVSSLLGTRWGLKARSLPSLHKDY